MKVFPKNHKKANKQEFPWSLVVRWLTNEFIYGIFSLFYEEVLDAILKLCSRLFSKVQVKMWYSTFHENPLYFSIYSYLFIWHVVYWHWTLWFVGEGILPYISHNRFFPTLHNWIMCYVPNSLSFTKKVSISSVLLFGLLPSVWKCSYLN